MSNDDPEKPPAPDDGPDPLAFSMSRRISDEEAHQLAALIKGKLAALFDQLKKDATPAAAGFFQGDNVDLSRLNDGGKDHMMTITRALGRLACFANCHPWAVLALVFASIVAVAGLGIAGAVSTFTNPTLSRVLLFAVITLVALVVIQRNFTKG